MQRSKHGRLWPVVAVAICGVMTACIDHIMYHHYEHTPLSGWERNDTLNFMVPRAKQQGQYLEEIGVRINGDYPFLGLRLIVSQTVYPSGKTLADTLECELIDKNGTAKGDGITMYQYQFPLTTLQLAEGDSLSVAIRHDMKREILPGIADIGVKLSKQ
ncbi:MAG: gliding motility lipoprotein GldH [Prevotella sp.]|nr:gliding motility lipoprotein GldH [Prevotella sp.]